MFFFIKPPTESDSCVRVCECVCILMFYVDSRPPIESCGAAGQMLLDSALQSLTSVLKHDVRWTCAHHHRRRDPASLPSSIHRSRSKKTIRPNPSFFFLRYSTTPAVNFTPSALFPSWWHSARLLYARREMSWGWTKAHSSFESFFFTRRCFRFRIFDCEK